MCMHHLTRPCILEYGYMASSLYAREVGTAFSSSSSSSSSSSWASSQEECCGALRMFRFDRSSLLTTACMQYKQHYRRIALISPAVAFTAELSCMHVAICVG